MNTIKIVGLGPSVLKEMTLGIYQTIMEKKKIFTRTKDHPAISELEQEGIEIHTFDNLYEKFNENFDQVYPAIVKELEKEAEKEEIIYAVPGHPNVAEKTVRLLQETDYPIEILGGKSFIDELFKAVKVDPVDGFQLVDSFDLNADQLQSSQHLVITQVFHSFIASDVKLTLMEQYPDEHEVYFVDAVGSSEENVEKVKLFEMDFFKGVNNLRSLYVPPLLRDERMVSFDTLQRYIDEITSENGDAWINQQTNQTLGKYFEEETDEFLEALEADDLDNMVEELGDVLMQIMYQTNIAEKDGFFSIEDVLSAINRKLRRRHPHVFEGVEANTPEEVDALWQEIKMKEKRGEIE